VGDALGAGALARCPRPCTVVFLDPPYGLVNEPAGWRRVRDQAAKLTECLSDDGFLVARTPWPFRHPAPEGTPPEPGHPTATPIAADLSIPGAAGPETHEYGSTAVHLYMRKK
jgi:hypothetical protein